MANVGYIRVSSIQQNSERQLDGVNLDRVFAEQVSGKDTNRPELKAMLAYVREGDTIHVHDLSRLGRNTIDVLRLVEELNSKGISIHFHKEGLITGQDNATSKMVLTIFAAVATAEREMMLERQREGIAAARKAGRISGRGVSKSVDREGISKAIGSGTSIRHIARDFNVSTHTVQRIKKEIEIITN